jgi:hypothetical protein
MAIRAWLAKRQTLSAALLLILALHLAFFPFIWGNKTLLTASRGPIPSIMPNGAWYGGNQGPTFSRGNDMGASGWLQEPDAALVHYEYFHEKHLPLWNPYQSYGAPLAANMQSQPFSPLFLLFALDPGPRTFNFFVLIRFFLTGLCTYLYLRLFLPFVPSIAGGIACMLSGYYIFFFDMPHLSVDILVPALFLATERLFRKQSTGNVLLSITVAFLCIVGGMPESALMVLAFGYAYFLFRLLVDPDTGAARIAKLKYFAFAQVLGLALAAFLLVPFFEFMGLAFDSHQLDNVTFVSGLTHDVFGLSFFTYLIPTLFGLAWRPIGLGLGGYSTLRGSVGVAQALFAIVAVGGLARGSKKPLPGRAAHNDLFLRIGFSDGHEAVWRARNQLDRESAVFPACFVYEVRGAVAGLRGGRVVRLRHASGLDRCGEPPPVGGIDLDRLCGASRGPGVVAVSGSGGKSSAACILYEPSRSRRRAIPGCAHAAGTLPARFPKVVAGRPVDPIGSGNGRQLR